MSKEVFIFADQIRPSIFIEYAVTIESMDSVNPSSDKFSLIVYKFYEEQSGLYAYYPIWYGWYTGSLNPIQSLNWQIQYLREGQDLKIHISKYLNTLYPNCSIRIRD